MSADLIARLIQESKLGRAFFGGGFSEGAAFAHVQLLNPAASGVVVYLTRFAGTNYAGSRLVIATRPTALSGASFAKNKLIGGAAGAATVHNQNNGSALGTEVAQFHSGTNIPTEIIGIGQPPIILAQGEGILVRGPSGNNIQGYFEWIEVPV